MCLFFLVTGKSVFHGQSFCPKVVYVPFFHRKFGIQCTAVPWAIVNANRTYQAVRKGIFKANRTYQAVRKGMFNANRTYQAVRKGTRSMTQPEALDKAWQTVARI